MGRRRKHPTTDGSVEAPSAVGEGGDKKTISEAAEQRLGLNNMICMSCNANNSPDADSCRKCGHTNLRGKKDTYADG